MRIGNMCFCPEAARARIVFGAVTAIAVPFSGPTFGVFVFVLLTRQEAPRIQNPPTQPANVRDHLPDRLAILQATVR